MGFLLFAKALVAFDGSKFTEGVVKGVVQTCKDGSLQ